MPAADQTPAPPADPPVIPWQQTLHHALWKASQSMHRTLNDGLSGLGLTCNQLALAAILQQHAPLSAADLARSQGLTPQTVNTTLAQVDRLGWITRRPHPVHKRVVLLELTEQGHEGVRQGRAIVDAEVARMSAAVGDAAAADAFVAALRRISDELDGTDTAGTSCTVPVSLWPERK
ncbi:hypothetical protein GCM10010329_32960 [Streptomyces spiroverticillatus]|uniref:HTH marR-type domain-containing protein n=1 Tax=Streptomyces finlayi TaxID=67296 RepID=A0A918WX66_9ACTN|nr:MarR family transcriptional regulator [Streptomyces finlayi]GHA07639.1 hypothetical protein GCM10010329_32960 [Streptomyces spiroverticillatus]GHC90927.1 hypothetical protein GCM10010334_25370 [Streptomyces finlayi]